MVSKSLSVATVIEKNRLSSDTPFLLLLDISVVDPATGVISEVLYLVRNTEPITYNGIEYEPTNFNLELKQEAGAAPTVNLSIRDLTRAIQERMQAYGGGVGFNVTVTVVNGAALSSPPEVVEYFQVVGATSDASYTVHFQLGAENPLAKVFPRRRQTRDFCAWRYRDPDTCGYSGGLPTCDLTLQGGNGCAAHNNEANFGAFPGITNKGKVYG